MKKGLLAFVIVTAVFASASALAQSDGSQPQSPPESKPAVTPEQQPSAKPAEAPAAKTKKGISVDEESLDTSQALSEGTALPTTKKLDWGALLLFEYGTNINTDRPDQYGTIVAAPQLKFMYDHSLTLKFSATYEFLDRIANYGWNVDDLILEYSYNKKVWEKREKELGLNVGGSLRYYIPVSLQSRIADSYGQLRFIGRSAFQVWKFLFGFDFNIQKYFNRYYTTNTAQTPGSPSWISESGKSDYVENNTDYGLGEKLYVVCTPVGGLDLTLSYAWLQSKRYDLIQSGDAQDIKYTKVPLPGKTIWSYATQFIADVTYSFSEIPAIKKSPKLSVSPIGHLALSAGYSALVPALQNGGAKVSYNPFDPLWGYFYFDLAVIY